MGRTLWAIDLTFFCCILFFRARNMHETVSDKIDLVIERPRPVQGCIDMPQFADCSLIIQTPHFNPDSYCNDNYYYSKFCCKSCTEAGRELFSEGGSDIEDS